MHTMIITTQDVFETDAIFVEDVEKAVDKLYLQNFDIVIFGKDIEASEEKKFRKILSLQNYEILVLRQEAEPLKFTVSQAKFMLRNYLYEKGKISIRENHIFNNKSDKNSS